MEDEYEALPEGSKTSHYMLAGACAGIIEHTAMYPIDSIKTRIQCLCFRNVGDAVKSLAKEGILTKSTYRGMMSVISGAGPAHALYFSVYENLKISFTDSSNAKYASSFVAGAGATLVHDVFMNPIEVIKQRMQLYQTPYKGNIDCLTRTLKTEGAIAFYRSFPTQVLMNIPYQSTHFMIYELSQDALNPNKTYQPLTHCVSGAVAGGVAAAITTPLDVCKTILNTQCNQICLYNNQKMVTGPISAVKTIYKSMGIRGFFKGVQARVLFQMPGTALSWSVYEFFKMILKNS